jgi:hypothetical protein
MNVKFWYHCSLLWVLVVGQTKLGTPWSLKAKVATQFFPIYFTWNFHQFYLIIYCFAMFLILFSTIHYFLLNIVCILNFFCYSLFFPYLSFFFPSFFSTSYLSSIFIYLHLNSTPSSVNLIYSTKLHYLHMTSITCTLYTLHRSSDNASIPSLEGSE